MTKYCTMNPEVTLQWGLERPQNPGIPGIIIKWEEKAEIFFGNPIWDQIWNANRKEPFFSRNQMSIILFLFSFDMHNLIICYVSGTVLGTKGMRDWSMTKMMAVCKVQAQRSTRRIKGNSNKNRRGIVHQHVKNYLYSMTVGLRVLLTICTKIPDKGLELEK